mmetsp:Transcript_58732/g.119543  ORF Transcript_58732/g.119543 Transcript_58732/m.119543 type:complete len:303 (-) Transcript_58732:189-1097(-)
MEYCKSHYAASTLSEPLTLASMVAVYLALVPAAVFLYRGQYIRMQKLLLLLAVTMNLRYLVFGMGPGISWFTNLFDLVNYLFIGDQTNCLEVPTLSNELPENTLLQMYTFHPSWATDFYNHFMGSGSDLSKLCLHAHVIFQTACLVLSFVHIFVARTAALQRSLGRASALCGTVGLTMAVLMGSEDGQKASYGGMWSVYGWYWMAGSSFFLLSKGILAVMRKDIKSHKRWMTRYYVSMWSDFLIFRLMLVVLTPCFSQCRSCALLTCIWLSPAIGLLLGQLVLSRGFVEDHRTWTAGYNKLK